MPRAASFVLAIGAGLIAASLANRYIWWVINIGDPKLADWASFGGLMPPAFSLAVFLIVTFGMFEHFNKPKA